MEKLINLLGIALMALVVISFSSCSNDDDEPETPVVKFVAPSIAWDSDANAVRSYMKSAAIPGVEEDYYEEVTDFGFENLRFCNDDDTIIYYYTFVGGKLKFSSIIYKGVNDQYQSLISQVAAKFGISMWTVKKDDHLDDYRSFVDNNTKTECVVHRMDNKNSIMIDFNYTDFQWPDAE